MTTTNQPVQNHMKSRRWPRWWWIAFSVPVLLMTLVVLVFAALYLYACANLQQANTAPVLSQTTQFDGRYLLAASDADMIGTAYADGQLMQIPGAVDMLTLVELPVMDTAARRIEIPVSNAVTPYPQIIAVSPDGSRIYVAEVALPVEDTVAQRAINALSPGRLVTVVDISKGTDAIETMTVDVGQGVTHLGISADGSYLAVGSRETGHQLALLPTATLDDPTTFHYFSVTDANHVPADNVTSMSWHPSGEFLAVGVSSNEVLFYRVTHSDDGQVVLTPHGERITGGITLTYGQFTQDGRFYLTSDINWDYHPVPLRGVINPPSEMISVRFDASDKADHAVVSRAAVGQSAEGFAVSPQEDLVVTVNMGRTYIPDGLSFWPGSHMNSLSLLSFDKETGELHTLGEAYGFEGVLPEAAMFDVDGSALGVVIYNDRENPMGPGSIEFWNVIRDGNEPRLERTAVQLDVVRGPHSMSLIP